MQRVTITLDDELMDELDKIIESRGYQNRSEAIRDLARSGILQAAEEADPKQDCIAAVVYVYDHAVRELSKRLTQNFHDHSELSLSSMHVHLDHDQCMEITVLKGKRGKVQHFAEHLIAERGVRHGRLVAVPLDAPLKGGDQEHDHGHAHGRSAARAKARADD